MATKEAGIKLTLTATGFTSGLGKAEEEAKRKAKSIGEHFRSALSDGLKNGLESLRSTVSTIKNTVTSIGGLAGGIGVAELLRGAVQTEGQFRKLAFAIRAGTGEAVNFRDIQRDVQAVALKTGQSTEDLAKAVQAVYQETGDADFARSTIESIATAATAAHEPVETMADIAGTLNEKFGVAKGQIGAALATAVSLGNRGGVSIGDLGEKLGMVGAFAKEAGLQGEEGFEKTVALMNVADNSTGSLKKGIAAVGGILETLGNKAARTKAAMVLGLDPSKLKGDALAQIGQILQATRGNKEKLERAFQGEQLKVLVDLGKTYSAAFDAQAGTVQDKTKAALAAYEDAIASAGKSALSYGDLQDEAAREMESSERQMAVALEKLRQAFAKPEITEALTKLMSKLPALADVVADLVDFATEHPVLAGAGALGLSVGNAVVSGAANSAFDALIKGAFQKGGQAAATEIASGLAGSAGGGLASSFLGALTSGPGLAIVAAALAAYFIADAIAEADKERQAQKEHAADTGEAYYEGGGGESGASAEGGMGAAGEHYQWKRDENGVLQAVPVDESEMDVVNEATGTTPREDADRRAALDAMMSSAEAEASGFMSPAAAASGLGPNASGSFGPAQRAGGGTGGMSAADARLLADMLGNKKLKVEVTNPEALRGPGGAAAPAPGNAPRK